ncbi:MAG TPA: hypothetical protein VFX73_02385 [Chitinophagaceae bacterium]|nr:hypothetical protein [Chitinophagaceae bacterium]
MDKHRGVFLDLSSELTGYSVIELEGTGLTDLYFGILCNDIGPGISEILFHTAEKVLEEKGEARAHAMQVEIAASTLLWPVCESLVMLWYQGQWTRMTGFWYQYVAGIKPPKSSPVPDIPPGGTFVPSAAAYTEQLSYRSAGAHPPGAHPTGFGSWSLVPVFGDFTIDNKKS